MDNAFCMNYSKNIANIVLPLQVQNMRSTYVFLKKQTDC